MDVKDYFMLIGLALRLLSVAPRVIEDVRAELAAIKASTGGLGKLEAIAAALADLAGEVTVALGGGTPPAK